MLQFFRSPDRLRLVFVIAFLLILRLAFIFSPDWGWLKAEFSWMLVGEYLSDGKLLYLEVWERLEPFTAYIYGLLYPFFGRTPLGYRLVAMGIALVQLFLFLRAISNPDLYRERTSLPVFVLAVLFNTHIEFFILSPALLANTFLLLALRHVFNLSEKTTNYQIFRMGIYLGLATLCFNGAFTYIFWGILGLATFRGTTAREYAVLVYGFLFPILGMGIYLYTQEALGLALTQLIVSFVSIDQVLLTLYNALADSLFILPVFLALFLGVFRVLQTTNFVNYQTVRQQGMILWLIFGLLGILLTLNVMLHQFVILLPPVAFFFTYFLMVSDKRWRMELAFLIYVLAVIGLAFQSAFSPLHFGMYQEYQAEKVLNPPPSFSGKRIWVLGEDPSFYQDNIPVMPYLNSRLFVLDLQETEHYDDLASIVTAIRKGQPELIIDPRQQFSILLRKVPILRQDYVPNAEQTEWRLREE